MGSWLFTYGSSTAPDHFIEEMGSVETVRPARVDGYRLTFVNYRGAFGGGTSAIIPAAEGHTIGTAYRINDEQRSRLSVADPDYGLVPISAVIDGIAETAEVLVPHAIHDFAVPTDAYLARIRYGLSYFYSITEVDAYLRRALEREWLFTGVPAQWMTDARPRREYNSLFRRLLPWKGTVRTPWGGAMATISPGDATDLFPHDEEELALVVAGQGELRLNTQLRPLTEGDLIYFEPGCEHVVTNTSPSDDLKVLFLWWGGQDGEMWAGHKI